MNWRNARYAFPGSQIIDCEIEHPEYGWIPFSANPNDPSGAEIYQAISSSGAVAEAEPLPNGISISTEV